MKGKKKYCTPRFLFFLAGFGHLLDLEDGSDLLAAVRSAASQWRDIGCHLHSWLQTHGAEQHDPQEQHASGLPGRDVGAVAQLGPAPQVLRLHRGPGRGSQGSQAGEAGTHLEEQRKVYEKGELREGDTIYITTRA